MKSILTTLAVASVATLLVSTSYADRPGTKVGVQVAKDYKPELKSIGGAAPAGRRDKTPFKAGWSYLEVPVTIIASEPNPRARDDGKPTRGIPHGTIDELEAHFYLAVTDPALNDYKSSELSRDDMKKLIVLEKTIKYVDVPVNELKAQSKKTTKVAVFISPATASKLTGGQPEKLKDKLVSLAVEFTYNGRVCPLALERKTSNPPFKNHLNYTFDQQRENLFSKRSDNLLWWKATSSALPHTSEYQLLSMAETPNAPQYGNYGFPPTSPMYGPEPPSLPSAAPMGEPSATGSGEAAGSSTGKSSSSTGKTSGTSHSTSTEADSAGE